MARWREALALVREGITALSAAERARDEGRTLRTMESLILLESGQARAAAAVWDSLIHQVPPMLARTQAARYLTYQYAMLAAALAAAGDTARLAVVVDTVAAYAARSINQRDARLADHARGLLLTARGDTSGAIAAFERAIYSPTSGFTRTNRDLGALLLARGRPADAARVLGAALRGGSLESGNLYVTYTELHELLARAYQAVGTTDSVRVHYQYVANALTGSDPGARDRHDAATRWLATYGATR